jgi:hypothetical protein
VISVVSDLLPLAVLILWCLESHPKAPLPMAAFCCHIRELPLPGTTTQLRVNLLEYLLDRNDP